jgi:flagellar basal-body rod protein FlgB
MKPMLPGNDPFLGQMERALDVMTRRQGLLASNVGNIDTPRYKTVDIDFKAALQQAVNVDDDPLELRRNQPGHMAADSTERLDRLVLWDQ